jgi:hypothetical protein
VGGNIAIFLCSTIQTSLDLLKQDPTRTVGNQLTAVLAGALEVLFKPLRSFPWALGEVPDQLMLKSKAPVERGSRVGEVGLWLAINRKLSLKLASQEHGTPS